MTFWQFLTNVYSWLEARTTRMLGTLQGLLAIALSQCFDADGKLIDHPLIPAKYIAYAMFVSAALVFLRGQLVSGTVAQARAVLVKDNPSNAPIAQLLPKDQKL